MVTITVGIEGMACGMCEAHINEAVRNAFQVKKVTSFTCKEADCHNCGKRDSGAGTEKYGCKSRIQCCFCNQ